MWLAKKYNLILLDRSIWMLKMWLEWLDLSKNVFNLRYSRSNRECCWWFRSRFFLVSFRYPVFFWDNSSHFRRLNTIFITQLRSISQNYLILNAAKSIQCMLFSNLYYQMSMKKLNLPRKILHLHWRLRRPCLQTISETTRIFSDIASFPDDSKWIKESTIALIL